MNILILALLGLVAGWIASVIMRTNTSQGMLLDIVFGILGAVLGGFVMNLFGQPGASGFNLYSIIVAVLGAVVLIWLERAIGRSFRRT